MRILSFVTTTVLAIFLLGCGTTTAQQLTDPDPAMAPPMAEVPPASAAAASPSQDEDDSQVNIDARPFPRQFTVQGTEFSIHQPQYDSWAGDMLKGRFVMSVKTGTRKGADGKDEETFDYGVITFNARSQIDKAARAVVLTNLAFDSSSFPTATDKQVAYLGLVRAALDQRDSDTLTLSLDQLESALSINELGDLTDSQVVSNAVPDIIFSTQAAVLILVEGTASLKPSGVSGVQRVINSRSLLLTHKGKYYTNIADHWLTADKLEGSWKTVASVDSALTQAMQEAESAKLVDTMSKPSESLTKAFDDGHWPTIYVRTQPAELIAIQGEPTFSNIDGTQLSYITNTGADVFVDAAENHQWYVLVSGRWFTGEGSQGPWSYVAADALPADFSNIPADNAKSGVLASIPGTPESKESLIANSIPQTATVNKQQATLTVQYDGAPDFKPISDTTLSYAWNTPVPVIDVPNKGYFAVDKGVWFTATAANGPWAVASSVPAEIYQIPTSSALHYVTYVRIYGGSGDDVYVGYTPGYYGTVVTNNVVVYGTGYRCSPWIGAYWYGCPATYGMGVYFGWNPWVGWTFGMGYGWYAGWYGAYSPWWGPWYGPVHRWGYWGGGAAAWNVYGHWGNAVVRGTAGAWANPWTGNYGRAARGGYYNEATGGRGVGRAAVNTNIYTGTTRAAAQGMRYNPETGRAVAGQGRAAVNPYTDQAAAAGRRTTVNTNTGRVNQTAGAVGAGRNGAAGVGGFTSDGNGIDAKGAGGFHYNSNTGELNRGGVVKAGDNVFAGHDGNVYRHGDDGWNQVTRPDRSGNVGSFDSQGLDQDRMARDRGNQRMSGDMGGFGGSQRSFGGFRGGLGGGGGFRGGGFRR